MLKLLSRLLLAGWFVGMVLLAVRGMPVQGQSGEGQKLHFPTMLRMAPSLFPYMGLVKTAGSAYYTVRADGSEWKWLATPTSEFGQGNGWSPNGTYFAYISDSDTGTRWLWLTDLATRQPRLVLDQSVYAPSWSPDSSRLAFLVETEQEQAFYIYDVATAQLTGYPLPFRNFSYSTLFIWSPTSDAVAWTERLGSDEDEVVWLWSEGNAPQAVLEIESYLHQVQLNQTHWSPDGIKLYITTRNLDTSAFTLYQTDTSATPATVWLTGYGLEGWIEEDSKILLLSDLSEAHLYVAEADGSNPVRFSDKRIGGGAISISPHGDWVVYGEYGTSALFIQATTSSTPVLLESCRIGSEEIRWQLTGPYFVCIHTNSNTTAIGTLATTPPQIVDYPRGQGQVLFLPQSDSYYSVDTYLTGYPDPRFNGTYLGIPETDYFIPIEFPEHETYNVSEWRYLP